MKKILLVVILVGLFVGCGWNMLSHVILEPNGFNVDMSIIKIDNLPYLVIKNNYLQPISSVSFKMNDSTPEIIGTFIPTNNNVIIKNLGGSLDCSIITIVDIEFLP